MQNGRQVRSMTGFGQGTAERNGLRVQVDLKGVNHRFLDIKMRLPVEISLLEPRLRSEVQGRVARGRIDLAVAIVSSPAQSSRLVINAPVVSEYLRAVADLKSDFRLKGSVGLETLLTLPGVVSVQANPRPDDGAVADLLIEALREALGVYDEMRAAEGKRLVNDLRARLQDISGATGRIEEEARGLPESWARRIKERVGSLLEGEQALDGARVAQEIAILANRMDITEELVRLRGYLTQAETTLTGSQGPIGKTLDFIMQEMNREANTISSKAEALNICQEALRIKAEVEKIREQAQNLE